MNDLTGPIVAAGSVGGAHENGGKLGWPRLSASAPFAHDCLLSRYLDSLYVRATMLERHVKHGSYEHEVLDDVHRQFDKFDAGPCPKPSSSRGFWKIFGKSCAWDQWKNAAWTQAYRIELLLLLAEPADRVRPELEYRLTYAEGIGAKGIAGLRQAYERTKISKSSELQINSAEDLVKDLRPLLLETTKVIHWTLTKKHLSRSLLRMTTRNIVFAALISFLAFILPYMWIFFDFYRSPDLAATDIRTWVGFPLLTCLSAGLFGSYFSRLHYIQAKRDTLSYDELVSARDIFAIIVRGSVGVCGAALLFFFLHSGIVAGTVVPNIGKMAIELNRDSLEFPHLLIANKDLALLILWGFLAGFSERLVPSILATTEGELIATGRKSDSAAEKA